MQSKFKKYEKYAIFIIWNYKICHKHISQQTMLQVMSWHIKSIQMETHGNATIVIKSLKLGHKKII